jgi:hypothetical protein
MKYEDIKIDQLTHIEMSLLRRRLDEEMKNRKCKHPAEYMQSFTECCTACGKNIWADD